MWGLALGAGLGLLKDRLVDEPRANRERKLAAATEAYSPWTGMHADKVKEADPFGSALQYGATGAMMNSNMNKDDAMIEALKKDPSSARVVLGGESNYGTGSPWDFSGSRNLRIG